MRFNSDNPLPQRAVKNRVSLPILAGDQSEQTNFKGRHPQWIRAQIPQGVVYEEMLQLVKDLGLNTVCASASCPNIGECWNRRSLTIMILGNICTRSCQFCDVPNGKPLPVDIDEPHRVATALKALNLKHTVITCVDRDDLPDGGAAHWAQTIQAVKTASPLMTLEVLTGDFKGVLKDVDTVLEAKPHIFAHNLETVPRLSKQVRVQARYERSLAVLHHAKQRGSIVKTSFMLGLGETAAEMHEVLQQLAQLKCDIVTMGQYLRPSLGHWPLDRYVHPDEFAELKNYALGLGIPYVEAGPMVRSSYHADAQAAMFQAAVKSNG